MLSENMGATPWDLVQDWDYERFGREVDDPDVRDRWANVFTVAGGLPYIWQELARPISEIAYGLLEVRPGDRVLLIGEGIEPAGWEADLQALVGPSGQVDSVEIIRHGREAVLSGVKGRNGMNGCWRWDYMDAARDNAYDCVAVMQATQHCDDWDETASELLRVTKPGRRIFFAEAVLSGDTFTSRVAADVHLQQWVTKLLGHHPPGTIPYYSGQQVADAFGDRLSAPQIMEWRGIEMFWGRKK